MLAEVEKDLAWSTVLFENKVWPIIKDIMGGGDLIKMESRPDSELALELDQKSGIDGWHICNNGIRGIASRIQKGDKAWNTFTIRLSRDSGTKTEYEKRLEAISGDKGWIYPHITVQAYSKTEDGPILSVGVARTEDIMCYIKEGNNKTNRTTNAVFAVCPWDSMKQKGYKVWMYIPGQLF